MQLEKLRALYPDLSEAELAQAAENLDRYLKLVYEIYQAMASGNREL